MATPKIVVTRRWPPAVERELTARHAVKPHTNDTPLSADASRDAMRHADALGPRPCPIASTRVCSIGVNSAFVCAPTLASVSSISTPTLRAAVVWS